MYIRKFFRLAALFLFFEEDEVSGDLDQIKDKLKEYLGEDKYNLNLSSFGKLIEWAERNDWVTSTSEIELTEVGG